jgi:peptidoglycan/LPS O-acetylase OafA/YrhL
VLQITGSALLFVYYPPDNEVAETDTPYYLQRFPRFEAMATTRAGLTHKTDTSLKARGWTLPAVVPELDGLRGVAIGLVLLCHAGMWVPIPLVRQVLLEGKMGVDLFFVLSGFLITGILLDTRRDDRRTRNFYLRRGLRIWPLYFGYLALAYVGTRAAGTVQPSLWTFYLFVQNFVPLVSQNPFLGATWSLAVEEQFYAIWPWVSFRIRRETLLRLCLVLFGISPLVRMAFHLGGASEDFIYANTFTRMDGIAVGGAIAAWMRGRSFTREMLVRLAKLAGIAGCAGYALCMALQSRSVIAEYLNFTFIALGFGGRTLLRAGLPQRAQLVTRIHASRMADDNGQDQLRSLPVSQPDLSIGAWESRQQHAGPRRLDRVDSSSSAISG